VHRLFFALIFAAACGGSHSQSQVETTALDECSAPRAPDQPEKVLTAAPAPRCFEVGPPFFGTEDRVLNGEHKRLQFSPLDAADRVAVGARLQMVVPRVPGVGHTFLAPRWSCHATARLETVPELFLSLQTAEHGDLEIEVTCRQPGVHRLGLTLVEPDGAELQDSFLVTCSTATSLSVELREVPPGAKALFLPGSLISAGITPHDAVRPLTGDAEPCVAAGESAIARVAYSHEFQAAHVAVNPRVNLLGLEATLPLEIVELPWAPRISVERLSTDLIDVRVLEVQAKAHAKTGDDLFGVPCRLTYFQGEAQTASYDGCRDLSYEDVPGFAPTWLADKVCVEMMGHTGCTSIPPP
jgi:hypothetical protein